MNLFYVVEEISFRIIDVDGQPLNIGLPRSAIEKANLNARADEKVLTMSPRLRNRPTFRSDTEGKKIS